MGFFNEWGRFMMAGARAQATWELEVSRVILRDKRRMLLLGLLTLPAILGGIAFADQVGEALPQFLGGKTAYSPAFYSTGIFVASILIGVIAGLITGCIGAGGGFVIAPAMMSAGIKGILAVGTDLFHIFAKAIMGSVIHRKLGNISVPLAVVFLIGAMIGATLGGLINRVLYEINPVLSDAFITVIYAVMLGFLGFYALIDFLRASNIKKKKDFHGAGQGAHGARDEGTEMGNLPQKIQAVKVPPLVKFDHDFTPGGRSISWIFLVLSGAL
ncbi:MAG: transrane protein, partial [Deltaproteobacteria bacterium]|nr:transrane protein [Deltaproteobacteria bacterium]